MTKDAEDLIEMLSRKSNLPGEEPTGLDARLERLEGKLDAIASALAALMEHQASLDPEATPVDSLSA